MHTKTFISKTFSNIKILSKGSKGFIRLKTISFFEIPYPTRMEKFALQETILIKKIENLKNELQICHAEMEFIRRYSSTEHKGVTNIPQDEKLQVIASPEQTATSKGITNPFIIPDQLVKMVNNVQILTVLEKSLDILNLIPNGGIQILEKSKE